MATGAVLVSLAAPFVRMADVAPTVSGFYRMAFACLMILFWLMLSKRKLSWSLRVWAGSFLAAFFFALDLWFWHRSIHWLGPGFATLLANLQVVIMALVGVAVFKERSGWKLVLSLLLAVMGLWLLVGMGWQGFSGQYRIGIVFGGLTALAYAAYLLTLRTVQRQAGSPGPLERMFQVSLCCGLILGFSAVVEQQSLALPDVYSTAVLLLYALLCQVLGWVFISYGLPALAVSIVGLLLLLQPSLSLLWDYLFFDLKAMGSQWLGAALVLVGIYLGAISKQRKPKHMT